MIANTSKSADEIVTAGLIVIGDEILSGQTKEQNVGFIANHLTNIGILLEEIRIVPDIEDRIIKALNEMRAEMTYVFTTGGIGPTHDDITSDAIAKAFGVPIEMDNRAIAMMRKRYKDADLIPARLRTARIPKGADLIENSISFMPGFILDNVIVMAGFPIVMQVMLDAVTPRLKKGKEMHCCIIPLDLPESEIAPLLTALQEDHPSVRVGSYPFYENGKLGTQIVLRSTESRLLKSVETVFRDALLELALG